jgi:NADP-dependent 3-hydroxy acid dehydrogenase YdfG
MSKVLITGCSTGIGRAVADELVNRGHHVIATARKVDTLTDLDVAERYVLDVTSDASVADLVASVPDVDVLVNNAGVAFMGPIESASLPAVIDAFDTNVFGALRLIQAYVPAMRERRCGRVVNLSSIAAPMIFPLSGIYGASKVALEAMSEALSLEVGHLGVTVSVIQAPSVVSQLGANSRRTPLLDDYQAIADGQATRYAQGAASAMSAEAAASDIADVIENPASPLRIVLTDGAHARVVARREMTDAAWAGMQRQAFGATS